MKAAPRVSGVKLTFITPIQGMDNNLIYCAFILKVIACLVLLLNHSLNTYYIPRTRLNALSTLSHLRPQQVCEKGTINPHFKEELN